MKIELISDDDYYRIVQIQIEHPILTYAQKGYDTVDKSKFSDADRAAFDDVTAILEKCVTGFSEFNNFNISRIGEIIIRMQYDWTADEPGSRLSYTGVGYVKLRELNQGFDNPKT